MAERAYNDKGDGPEDRRRKLMKVVRELGLTREERMEFASYFLRRDITTWKTLTDQQRWRLLDAIEGYDLLLQMQQDRGYRLMSEYDLAEYLVDLDAD
jgi:hypothetical protein